MELPKKFPTLRKLSRHYVTRNVDYSFLGDVSKRMGLIPAKHRNVLSKASGSFYGLLSDPNRGLRLSARHGFKEAFKFFTEIGATSFGEAMSLAALHGHIKIVELCPNKEDVDLGLSRAAQGGNFDIVDLLISWGATGINAAIQQAARVGDLDMVKYLSTLGVTELGLNMAMACAASAGHYYVMEYLKELGAKNYDYALRQAALKYNYFIVDKCLEWGATPTNSIKTIKELNERNDEMVKRILKKQ